MAFNPTIFKAYDIRGIVPTDIDAIFSETLGRAFVSYLQTKGEQSPTVVVARDNRLSSDALTESLIKGLLSQGADVLDCGLASTPQFDWVVLSQKASGGIMVTASHNPPEYNGFKLMGPGILAIGVGSGMEEIREFMNHVPGITYHGRRGAREKKDFLEEYIDACFVLVPPRDGVEKLKVIVDTGNGVSALMARAHFDRLPCAMTPLFFELDGTFPNHEPNPLKEENLRFLKEAVLSEKADLGIALDTDGDRIIVIDETGVMTNDVAIALLAEGFLAEHAGAKILYDIRSSHTVPETIRACGGIPVVTPIGHTLIKQAMKRENGLFAGELSGHYYFRDMGNFEAPILVINTVLNLLAESGRPLSELVRPLRRYYHTGEINFHVEDKQGLLKKIEETFSDATLSRLDGITLEYSDWWANVRPSNTENLLRLNLEANTEELREAKRKQLEALILQGKQAL